MGYLFSAAIKGIADEAAVPMANEAVVAINFLLFDLFMIDVMVFQF